MNLILATVQKYVDSFTDASDMAATASVNETQRLDETEYNDSFGTADIINNSYAGIPDYGIIGQITDVYCDLDFYRFTVTTPGTLTAYGFWAGEYYKYGFEDYLAIGLYDSLHNLITYSTYYSLDDTSTIQQFSAYLSSGTYYLLVLQLDDLYNMFVNEPYAMAVHFEPTTASVSYQSHVQNIGWQDWASNGGASGTSGLSYRLEAMRISLNNTNGGIQYKTHVQNIGWQDWVSDGAITGTSGLSYRLEAIQMQLTGAVGQHT